MNAKQATRKMDRARLVKQIADMEFVNRMNQADIVSYNCCIDDLIAGKSPCPYCHDYEGDCEHPDCREAGKGCPDWMLKMKTPEEVLGGSGENQPSGKSENNSPS